MCRDGRLDTENPDADGELSGQVQLSCPFGELYALFDFGQVSANAEIDCDAIKKGSLAEA